MDRIFSVSPEELRELYERFLESGSESNVKVVFVPARDASDLENGLILIGGGHALSRMSSSDISDGVFKAPLINNGATDYSYWISTDRSHDWKGLAIDAASRGSLCVFYDREKIGEKATLRLAFLARWMRGIPLRFTAEIAEESLAEMREIDAARESWKSEDIDLLNEKLERFGHNAGMALHLACEAAALIQEDYQESHLKRRLSKLLSDSFSKHREESGCSFDWHDGERGKLRREALEILSECADRAEAEKMLDGSWILECRILSPNSRNEAGYSCQDMDADIRRPYFAYDICCLYREHAVTFLDEKTECRIEALPLSGGRVDFQDGCSFVYGKMSGREMLEKAGLNPDRLLAESFRKRKNPKTGL